MLAVVDRQFHLRGGVLGRGRLRWGRISGALAMVAVMVLGVSFAATRAGGSRELTFNGQVGAFMAAPETADLPLSFSDGTRIVLTASAHATA